MGDQASKYISVLFPPFNFPVKFILEFGIVKNNPDLQSDWSVTLTTENKTNEPNRTFPVHSRKTELTMDDEINQERQQRCPIHKANHFLNHCRSFSS